MGGRNQGPEKGGTFPRVTQELGLVSTPCPLLLLSLAQSHVVGQYFSPVGLSAMTGLFLEFISEF